MQRSPISKSQFSHGNISLSDSVVDMFGDDEYKISKVCSSLLRRHTQGIFGVVPSDTVASNLKAIENQSGIVKSSFGFHNIPNTVFVVSTELSPSDGTATRITLE